ncbi:hypothetical protein UFOVP587_31 [uncultured Caudovirales phage]|uniref:DUF7192 domain-containing protein n=1 Tax=uncultured Caudovirales phage TaxID=2100421 RepID=A0A6J5N305_9CAUD|nr:hypothetical protein UFOVP587_31 [uncultured Caudovirales phage]
MKKTYKQGTVDFTEFDSLGEYIRYAKDNPTPKDSNQPKSGSFNYTETLAEACNLATHGWDEIRAEVDAQLDELVEHINDAFGEFYVSEHSTSGAFVDMGRFVTGEPECMVSFVSEPQARMGRVVKIVMNAVVSGHVPADLIKRRGIAVLALIDTIHKLGVGIELWWEESLAGGKQEFSTLIKLHSSEEPMDINSLMFSLAHPDMLRRLQFSVQEQHKDAKSQGAYSGGGYGLPRDLMSPRHCDYDVTIEKLQNGDQELVANTLQWVLSTVQGLGLVEVDA